jgi:hypothetical protein
LVKQVEVYLNQYGPETHHQPSEEDIKLLAEHKILFEEMGHEMQEAMDKVDNLVAQNSEDFVPNGLKWYQTEFKAVKKENTNALNIKW